MLMLFSLVLADYFYLFFSTFSRLSMHLDYQQRSPSYLRICRLIYETSESFILLICPKYTSLHSSPILNDDISSNIREDANILSCIPASNIFIEAGIEAGGVLVHCFGGRSRSAAFVAAYLMSSRSWGFDQALAVISAVRPVASVNRGFERQLRAYAQTGYDVYAAQQVLLRNRIRALHDVRGSWRSPTTQSFRKHRSAGKPASSNGSSSSRNVGGCGSNLNRRTDSSSSSNDYDAKGSHGIGLGCDSFSYSNGIFLSIPLSPFFLSIYLSPQPPIYL